MLYWALMVLAAALLASLVGFGGVLPGVAALGRGTFVLCLLLFVILLMAGLAMPVDERTARRP